MHDKFNGIAWTGSNLLNVQAPDPWRIRPEDVAHGLARKFRFGGHTRRDLPGYSVAWHSLFCESLADEMGLPIWVRLQALLHDAPEFILGDMITPVKRLLPGYVALEAQVWRAVARRWKIPEDMHPAVHEIDAIALQVEAAHLITSYGREIMELPDPPAEWATFGAAWIDFAHRHTFKGDAFPAALFHSRLRALEGARAAEGVTE